MMLHKWDAWYKNASMPQPYGDPITYLMAEMWLHELDVEDWGCGYTWFKNVHYGGYKGVDGTWTRWCDEVADLAEYTSSSPGILLRHVLEHNHDWKKVLDNAVASFTKRLCIVLFTPLVSETKVIVESNPQVNAPDIAFSLRDITDRLGSNSSSRHVSTFSVVSMASQYNVETVICAKK